MNDVDEVVGATFNEGNKTSSEDPVALSEGSDDSLKVDQDDSANQTGDSVLALEELEGKTVRELRELAKEAGLTGYSGLLKAELIEVLLND